MASRGLLVDDAEKREEMKRVLLVGDGTGGR